MKTISLDDPELEAVWQALARASVRSVAVMGVNQGEGASVLAAGLARRAALAGGGALAVDLHAARPALAGMFGVPVAAHVTKVPDGHVGVLGRVDAASAQAWREPAQLVSQLTAWGREWPLVVLDCPPVLSAAGDAVPATSAAAAAEATVLVTLAGRTSAMRIREARARLQACGANLVGVVMNDRDNPPLLMELRRQIGRLGRVMPRRAASLAHGLGRSATLSVRI